MEIRKFPRFSTTTLPKSSKSTLPSFVRVVGGRCALPNRLGFRIQEPSGRGDQELLPPSPSEQQSRGLCEASARELARHEEGDQYSANKLRPDAEAPVAEDRHNPQDPSLR